MTDLITRANQIIQAAQRIVGELRGIDDAARWLRDHRSAAQHKFESITLDDPADQQAAAAFRVSDEPANLPYDHCMVRSFNNEGVEFINVIRFDRSLRSDLWITVNDRPWHLCHSVCGQSARNEISTAEGVDFRSVTKNASRDLLSQAGAMAVEEIFSFIWLLERCRQEVVERPLSASQRRRAEQRGQLDLHRYTRLTLDHTMVASLATRGSGYKQRLHERRGHWRRIAEGRRIWINPYLAGDPERGVVEKTYRITE